MTGRRSGCIGDRFQPPASGRFLREADPRRARRPHDRPPLTRSMMERELDSLEMVATARGRAQARRRMTGRPTRAPRPRIEGARL